MMIKQGCFILACCITLTGCFNGVWTGAKLIYDRHNVYKKLSDYQLSFNANTILFKDRLLKQKGCALDLTVFHGDILLSGHVPSRDLWTLAKQRFETIEGFRQRYFQVSRAQDKHNWEDAWITARIRTQIFRDSTIDPGKFKITTVDKIVYIMGDVDAEEAHRVLKIATNLSNVVRVVNLMRYQQYSKPMKSAL